MGIRTPDLLHAIRRQHVHPHPSVQVTVPARPPWSASVRAGRCTFLLYQSSGQAHRGPAPGWSAVGIHAIPLTAQGSTVNPDFVARIPRPYGGYMRGDEARVVAAFVAWLEHDGWTVKREVDLADVYAERGAQRLYAEAKGQTAAVGLDVDTLYGQLLRPCTTQRLGRGMRLWYQLPQWLRRCGCPSRCGSGSGSTFSR